MKISNKLAAFLQAHSQMLTSRDFIVSVVGEGTEGSQHVEKNYAGLVATDALCVLAALMGMRRNWVRNYLQKAKNLAEGNFSRADRWLLLILPRVTWHTQQILLLQDGQPRLFNPDRIHVNGSYLKLFAEMDHEEIEKDRRQVTKWAGPIYNHLKEFS